MKNIHMITYLTDGNTFAIKISPNCDTAWKGSKFGVFWGSYFPAFSPNAGKKYEPHKTPCQDTFHTVKGESQYL